MDQYKKNVVKILKQIKDSNPETLKILVPQFMSKKISTYMLIREDLLFVKETANKLKEVNDNTIKENLWYSLIAIYGRCFTDASKSKKPKLESKDIFNSESHKLEQFTHEKLIDIRHTFLAHRGDNENEIPVVYLEMPKNEEINDENLIFQIVSTRYTSESKEFLDDVINLCEFLLAELNKKFTKRADKLLSAILELDKEVLKQLTMK